MKTINIIIALLLSVGWASSVISAPDKTTSYEMVEYTTKPGDSVSRLAKKFAGGDASETELRKLSRKIFQLNPRAFESGDINKLMKNMVIMVPVEKKSSMVVTPSSADQGAPVSVQDLAAFKKQLIQVFPQFGVKDVAVSPLNNIYQVELKSGELIYISGDARHIFSGDLLRVEPTGIVNLSENWRGEKRVEALRELDDKNLVVYPAVGQQKAELVVFTDTSCGYCRKFHTEIPQLNAKGVTVKYAAWPRAGVSSPAGQTMVNIWCSKNREQAMDNAKRSQPVAAPEGKTCDQHVVQDQINLGRELGIRGTPAVFALDGRQLGGYVPADKLLQQFGIQ